MKHMARLTFPALWGSLGAAWPPNRVFCMLVTASLVGGCDCCGLPCWSGGIPRRAVTLFGVIIEFWPSILAGPAPVVAGAAWPITPWGPTALGPASLKPLPTPVSMGSVGTEMPRAPYARRMSVAFGCAGWAATAAVRKKASQLPTRFQ